MCLLGYTDAQLADYFNVTESTLNSWKKLYPDFLSSIRDGKQHVDANVASALYKKACGFQYNETTYEKIIQSVDGIPSAEEEDIKLEVNKKKIVTKMFAPDTLAAQFWLKNRQPKIWREKTEGIITNINTAPMTAKEMREISKALENDC